MPDKQAIRDRSDSWWMEMLYNRECHRLTDNRNEIKRIVNILSTRRDFIKRAINTHNIKSYGVTTV